MTEDVEVPGPIRALVEATNAGDTEAFLATFADDAYLADSGRDFHGRSGAASWNQTDNIGVHANMTIRAVRAGEESGDYLVDISVTSNRFNGDGTIEFSVRDGQVSRLVIG